MSDIFISYSRVDRPRIEKLAAALEASGFSIWWDKNLEGGSEFSKETEARLDGARAVLVCWSKTSVDSMWVADEATVGRDKRCLVPIAIDAVAPKLGFRQIQTIDFSTWNGDAGAPEFVQLEKALRAKLSPDAAAKAAPSPRLSAPPRQASPLDNRVWLALIAAILTGVAIFAWSMRRNAPAPDDLSIAVLPFEDRSLNNEDSEYGDWLADLISSLLGKSGDLTVISQTSASAFKDEAVAMRDVARRLGVSLIVDGSVRAAGADMLISIQLVDAATGRQLWSEIYERKTGDALAAQSEVAAKAASAVAAALNVSLSESERAALTPQTSPEALEAYQEALQLYRTTNEANIRSAQRLLNEAVRLDPDFALAWALLSRVHSYFYFNSSDATQGRKDAARTALDRALGLEPDLAEVMLADAYYSYWIERDYVGARTRFEGLHEKWPNNTDILTALASIARRQGRWDDSKEYFERAVAIDPLRPGRRMRAAEANLATRDFAGALELLDASLAIWPSPPDSTPFIAKKALVYLAQGRLDQSGALLQGLDARPDAELLAPIVLQGLLDRAPGSAISLVDAALKQDDAEGSVGRASIDLNLYLGDLRRLAGDADAARQNYGAALGELRVELSKQPDSADIHSYLALAYSGLGEREKAIFHAARAVEIAPIEKDALSGVYYLDVEARVLSRLGDGDAAIPAIAALMKLPAPLPLTPALLRLDPDFDRLRSEPRFKALLETSAP